jgi:hypothetical protein
MTTPRLRLDHTFFDNEERPHLGAVLLKTKMLRPEQLDFALDRQRGTGKRLGDVLVELGLLYEQDISRAIALQNKLPYIDLSASGVDPRAAAKLNPDFGQVFRAIGVRLTEEGLLVAVADPWEAPHERLVVEAGMPVTMSVADGSEVARCWRELLRGRIP